MRNGLPRRLAQASGLHCHVAIARQETQIATSVPPHTTSCSVAFRHSKRTSAESWCSCGHAGRTQKQRAAGVLPAPAAELVLCYLQTHGHKRVADPATQQCAAHVHIAEMHAPITWSCFYRRMSAHIKVAGSGVWTTRRQLANLTARLLPPSAHVTQSQPNGECAFHLP